MKKMILTMMLLLVCIAATACAGLKADTRVVNMSKQHVAYTEYVGDYEQHPEQFDVLVTKLFTWADNRKLLHFPDKTKLITILPDELNETPQNRRRLQMAIVVPEGTKVSGDIKQMKIPGGRYGVGRFIVSDDEIGNAWNYMFEKWLPQSGHELADRPLFQILTNDPESHPQRKNIIDIYIPVS